MKIIEKSMGEIKPYKNNPRKNEEAVQYVANSIRQFGFKVPIVIDKDGVIIAGHTRYKAAKLLDLEKIPCVLADDLTEEQVKAFRIADNKTAEASTWDYGLLEDELEIITGIDMQDFGFVDTNYESIEDELSTLDSMHSESKPKKEKTVTCPNCGEIIVL